MLALVAVGLYRFLGLRFAYDTTSLKLPPAAVEVKAQGGMTPINNTPAPNFHLTDQWGHPISLTQLRGKVVVLTIFDPVCWWDCPLNAQELKLMLRYLPRSARNRVAVVDIASNIKVHSLQAVRAFGQEQGLMHIPQMYLLTSSSLDTLESVWKHYYIGLSDVSVPKNQMVNHPDIFYLINPNGQLAYLSNPDATKSYFVGTAQLLAAYTAHLLGTHADFGKVPLSATHIAIPYNGKSPLAMAPGGPVMVTAEDGWKVAWTTDNGGTPNPNAPNQGTYEVLLHTTDGGRHWQNVSPTGISKRGGIVAAYGSGGNAWVVVLPYGYESTALAFTTTNGGSSWHLTRVLPGGTLPKSAGTILVARHNTAYLLTQKGILQASGTDTWKTYAPLPAHLNGKASLGFNAQGQLVLHDGTRVERWNPGSGWQ